MKISASHKIEAAMQGLVKAYRTASPTDKRIIRASLAELKALKNEVSGEADCMDGVEEEHMGSDYMDDEALFEDDEDLLSEDEGLFEDEESLDLGSEDDDMGLGLEDDLDLDVENVLEDDMGLGLDDDLGDDLGDEDDMGLIEEDDEDMVFACNALKLAARALKAAAEGEEEEAAAEDAEASDNDAEEDDDDEEEALDEEEIEALEKEGLLEGSRAGLSARIARIERLVSRLPSSDGPRRRR